MKLKGKLVASVGVSLLVVGTIVGQKLGWFEDRPPIPDLPRSTNPPRSLIEIDGIQFQGIPPGRSSIGSPPDEPGHQDDEGLRAVEIRGGFAISAREITNRQYWSVIDPSRSLSPAEASRPVANVNWGDALEFCRQLTARNKNHVFRLPTEEEWEYCCRAGTGGPFGVWEGDLDQELDRWRKFGDDGFVNRHAPRSFNFGSDSPRPVGSYRANAFGLHDMHGNVWEWCSGPGPSPRMRPIRGGAFSSPRFTDCRSAKRAFEVESSKRPSIGLRVVLETSDLPRSDGDGEGSDPVSPAAFRAPVRE